MRVGAVVFGCRCDRGWSEELSSCMRILCVSGAVVFGCKVLVLCGCDVAVYGLWMVGSYVAGGVGVARVGVEK